MVKKSFFLVILSGHLSLFSSLQSISEGSPLVTFAAAPTAGTSKSAGSSKAREHKEKKELAEPAKITGASFFMYHGPEECLIRYGVGLRSMEAAKCPVHSYYERSVKTRERAGKLLLVFYNRSHKPMSSALVKKDDDRILLHKAREQLDPNAKPIAAVAEIELNCHKQRTITFRDKNRFFLATVSAPDSFEIPLSIVQHGKASLGNAIEYSPNIQISHVKARANLH